MQSKQKQKAKTSGEGGAKEAKEGGKKSFRLFTCSHILALLVLILAVLFAFRISSPNKKFNREFTLSRDLNVPCTRVWDILASFNLSYDPAVQWSRVEFQNSKPAKRLNRLKPEKGSENDRSFTADEVVSFDAAKKGMSWVNFFGGEAPGLLTSVSLSSSASNKCSIQWRKLGVPEGLADRLREAESRALRALAEAAEGGQFSVPASPPAWAQPKTGRAHAVVPIAATADSMWDKLKGFNADFHVGVVEWNVISGFGIGAQRVMKTAGKDEFSIERCLDFDPVARTMLYRNYFGGHSNGMTEYMVTIRVNETGPHSCAVEWESTGVPVQIVEGIQGAYVAATQGLARRSLDTIPSPLPGFVQPSTETIVEAGISEILYIGLATVVKALVGAVHVVDNLISDIRYQTWATKLVSSVFAIKGNWLDAPVPLPNDDVQYSGPAYRVVNGYEAAAFVPHVVAKQSAQVPDVTAFYTIKEAFDLWPTNVHDKWASAEQARSDLFSDFTPPPSSPYPLASLKGLSWYYSTSMGALFLTKIDRLPSEIPFTRNLSNVMYLMGSGDFYDNVYFGRNKRDLSYEIYFYVDMNDKSRALTLIAIRTRDGVVTDQSDPGMLTEAIRQVETSTYSAGSIREHALWTHFMLSDQMTTDAQNLRSDHPIRRLNGMNEYMAYAVNDGAVLTLLAPGGTVQAMYAPSDDGLVSFLSIASSMYRPWIYQYPPGLIRSRGMSVDDVSWSASLTEMNEWWKIIFKVTSRYVNTIYGSDAEAEADPELMAWWHKLPAHFTNTPAEFQGIRARVAAVTALYMFGTTVYHEACGSETYRLVGDPFEVTSSLWQGKTAEEKVNDILLSFRVRVVAYSTTLRSPKFQQNWGFMAGGLKKESELKKIWDDFENDMKTLTNDIKNRNKGRAYPSETLLPAALECSVAV